MKVILGLLLPALAVAAGPTRVKRQDTWGGSVSLGPSKSNIVNAVTTIIPGTAPSTQNGELFLWPGMSNGTGNLIQTTLESWPDNSWCGATTGQWCVRASLFGSFGQLSGNASAVSGSDQVRIEYNLESDGQTWLQTVTNAQTGALLSSFSYASGPYMDGYGTGTECDSDCTGTIAPQQYINTQITLDSPDETFGDTIATAAGASYTGLASSNGGQVWTIQTINIPAMITTTTTTTSSSSTSSTSTSSTSTSSTSSSSSSTSTAVAQEYGQCGGENWTGPTVCASPYTCEYQNAYYSQCL